jgi:hypothetical protein
MKDIFDLNVEQEVDLICRPMDLIFDHRRIDPNGQSFYTSIYERIDFVYYQYVLSMNQYEQDRRKHIYQRFVMYNHHKLIHNHSKIRHRRFNKTLYFALFLCILRTNHFFE